MWPCDWMTADRPGKLHWAPWPAPHRLCLSLRLIAGAFALPLQCMHFLRRRLWRRRLVTGIALVESQTLRCLKCKSHGFWTVKETCTCSVQHVCTGWRWNIWSSHEINEVLVACVSWFSVKHMQTLAHESWYHTMYSSLIRTHTGRNTNCYQVESPQNVPQSVTCLRTSANTRLRMFSSMIHTHAGKQKLVCLVLSNIKPSLKD